MTAGTVFDCSLFYRGRVSLPLNAGSPAEHGGLPLNVDSLIPAR